MSTQNNKPLSTNKPTTKTSSTKAETEKPKSPEVIKKLAPSMWLRAMTDFDAPFGHDGLPTVWG